MNALSRLVRLFAMLWLAAGVATAATPIRIGFPLEIPIGIREAVELRFETEVGKIYQVEVSSDLKSWANDGYSFQGNGGEITVLTTNWNLPKLFYRVRDDGDASRLAPGGIQGPPGPPGPPGPQGPPGPPPDDHATAAQGAKADTALQPGYVPSASEAQAFRAALAQPSLLDRFDRSDRYAGNQPMVHLAALPEVGPAWRIATSPANHESAIPYVQNGAFVSADLSHCYLGNTVASPGRKFSLFFEFSFSPTGFTKTGNRLGMNVSFDSNTMITDAGVVRPGGVVHINWDDLGIRQLNFFDNNQAYRVDAVTDTITVANHQFLTGDGFFLSGGTMPTPLVEGTTYYAKVISASEIKAALTATDAHAGNTIDITSTPPQIQILSYVHAPFTPLNRVYDGYGLYWHPQKRPLIPDKRYVMFLSAEGQTMEVGIVGVGSILLHNPHLPSHIGEEFTNFWWEPGGATLASGARYEHIGKLHSVWSQPSIDASWLSSYGGGALAELATSGPATFHGRVQSLGAASMMMAGPLPPLDIRFMAGATSTLPRGSQSLASGGHFFAEGGYLSNVGGTGFGSAVIGRAPMAIDAQMADPIPSMAGTSDAKLKEMRWTPALEPGDSEEFELLGLLAGSGSKRIRLTTVTGNQTVFDSQTLGAALNSLTGPFSLSVIRHARTSDPYLCFVKFQAGSVNLLHRFSIQGLGDNPGTLDFRAPTAEAGGVILETIRHTVSRVKNR